MRKSCIALFLALCWVSVAHGQNSNASCTKEVDQQTTSGNSGTLTFPDGCGMQSNTWEIKISGAPTSASFTLSGCMRGGTCTVIGSSTATASTNIGTGGGPYDSYQIAWTFTGGASPLALVNRTGTVAKGFPPGAGAAPNGITVAGGGTLYRGSSFCDSLRLAMVSTLTSGVKAGGIFNAEGYTNNAVCPLADMLAMDLALQSVSGATQVLVGCPFSLYLPLAITTPATAVSPAVGSLTITPGDTLLGCNPMSVSDNFTTHIIPCRFTDVPVVGCTTPQTYEFAITSTSATCTGNTITDRCYGHVTGSGFPFVGGDPIHINAGGLGQNNLNITGQYTVAQLNAANINVTSFAGASGSIVFTNSGTNGLIVNQPVTLSGFGTNPGLNGQTVTVTATNATTSFTATVTGSGYASGAGTASYGSPRFADSKAPANPTTTDFYVPIEDGLLAVTLTPGSANGTYDQNLAVTVTGGVCIIPPRVDLTFSGGAGSGLLTGAFITHAGKCSAVPTLTVVDPTGTVGTGASIVGFHATSAAGNIAGWTCPATCGSIVHGEIGFVNYTDNSGSNQTATMGSQVGHLQIDCGQLPDCANFVELIGNEHTIPPFDVNFTGFVERAIDIHGKLTNSGNPIDNWRAVIGKTPNQIVPFTASGNGTVSGTTLLTATSGTGFNFGFNGAANACNYANKTPVLIDGAYNYITNCAAFSATAGFSNGSAIITATQTFAAGTPVVFQTTGTLPTNFSPNTVYYVSATGLTGGQIEVSTGLATTPILAGSAGSGTQTVLFANQITLGVPVGNGAHSYYVPGIDAGTEAGYFADGCGHGASKWTVDYSAAPTQLNFPYSTSQPSLLMQLPNTGIRVDCYFFGTSFVNGHAERSQYSVIAGDGAPVRGVAFRDVFGQPNCYANVVGSYQNRQCGNLYIVDEFAGNNLNSTFSSEYCAQNITNSFNSIYTLIDDNPVGLSGPTTLAAGAADLNNVGNYCVEWTSVYSPAGNVMVANVNSTTPFGNSAPSGNQHASQLSTTLAAAIGTTTLCGAITNGCNVPGTYKIHWDIWGGGTACANVTAGSVGVNLSWIDQNTITHAAVAVPMVVQTGANTTATQATMPFATALANEGASGDYTVTTNGSVMQISTTYVPCTTGTGTYTILAVVSRPQ